MYIPVLKKQRVWPAPATWLTVLLIVLFAICALAPGIISTHDPLEFDYLASLEAPSLIHPFGTDNYGRDVFSRTVWAVRTDLQIAVFSTVPAMLAGTLVGLFVGYYGGIYDMIFNRIVDCIVTMPVAILVIAMVAFLGSGLGNMYLAMAGVGWIIYAKLVRAEVLVQRQNDYLLAAKLMGYSDARLIFRHLLPNVAGPILVYWMSDMALAILLGSSLGYLGLGAQPPIVEWGLLIADGRNFITTAWWISVFPGIAIVMAGLTFSRLGTLASRWLEQGR